MPLLINLLSRFLGITALSSLFINCSLICHRNFTQQKYHQDIELIAR
ncbi:hypothetical protein GPLA_3971 [Paraglaciecola polaris LMG 21857]|uniref:Uncharacterized protein n=1 Tax=Paraglaciecola polaris LMG 21857 TaxID=1129793 RepID=K7AHY8_9ALTE|nr:hypothetical protein GPLA_3971 [Paraglaciecola polaris LMG 21857]